MFDQAVVILEFHSALSEAKGVVVAGRILKNKIFCRYQGNLKILEGATRRVAVRPCPLQSLIAYGHRQQSAYSST